MNKNNPNAAFGAFLAVGVGSGTAIGVAIGNPAIGVALGVAFGVVLGMIARRKQLKGNGEQQ